LEWACFHIRHHLISHRRHIGGTSSAMLRAPLRTSAAEQRTSAADHPYIGGTSAADVPKMRWPIYGLFDGAFANRAFCAIYPP
jgi:hypothetical protein